MACVLRSTAFAALLALAACAAVPAANAHLEQARLAVESVSAITDADRLAHAELEQAREVLRAAQQAWATLQDPAFVDHLAYVARQRAAIARATIVRMREQETLTTRSMPCEPRDASCNK
jgi:hypothetical protein